MPDPDLQLIMEVNSLDVGVGLVLSQQSTTDQKLHPYAFFSHCLSPTERKYNIGNRELLVVKLTTSGQTPLA